MSPRALARRAPCRICGRGRLSFWRSTGCDPLLRLKFLMNKLGLRAVAALGVGFLVAGCAQTGSDGGPEVRAVPTVLVVDSSASMAEDDAPGPRIDAAKQASAALMEKLPEGTPTSLITYGANTDDLPESQAASCEDITVLRPLAPLEADAEGPGGGTVTAAIDGLAPGGFTPIGRSLEIAAAELAGADAEGQKAIVLISDGEDTCGDPTPCEAARTIKQAQPDVVISTIGFKSDVDELACVARETGGLYLTADNVDQLVSRVVAAQNAPAGEAALTPTGRSGVELGQHFDEIRTAHPDFPSQNEGVLEDDLTVIRWVDCDWVFDTSGQLVEIRDAHGSTIDGLGSGDSAEAALALYGDPVETTSGSDGEWVGIYPASREAGTAWKIAYDAGDEIRSIVLCACLPGGGTTTRFKGIPDGVPEWARQPGGPAVEVLRPVDAAGVVQPGWEVTDKENVDCIRTDGPGDGTLYPSAAAVEPGTIVCASEFIDSTNHCWPAAGGGSALCVMGPFSRDLTELPSSSRLTGQGLPTYQRKVYGLELANGEQCYLPGYGGGTAGFVSVGGVSYGGEFHCQDGDAYRSNGDYDSPHPFAVDGGKLSIRYSTNYETVTDVVEVTKLIFLGTA